MFRTFNMGVGMVVVVAPEDLHEVEHSLERRGEASFVIGTVAAGDGVTFEWRASRVGSSSAAAAATCRRSSTRSRRGPWAARSRS